MWLQGEKFDSRWCRMQGKSLLGFNHGGTSNISGPWLLNANHWDNGPQFCHIPPRGWHYPYGKTLAGIHLAVWVTLWHDPISDVKHVWGPCDLEVLRSPVTWCLLLCRGWRSACSGLCTMAFLVLSHLCTAGSWCSGASWASGSEGSPSRK